MAGVVAIPEGHKWHGRWPYLRVTNGRGGGHTRGSQMAREVAIPEGHKWHGRWP